MKPENLNWLTQKEGSVDCGAVAILNAKLWMGEKVSTASLSAFANELGISVAKAGISGSNLNRWISKKRNFGVQRIAQPSLNQAELYLQNGCGLILRYIWEVDGRSGAHFVFMCRGSRGRVIVTNPHRLSPNGKYDRWRYFGALELRKCFKRKFLGVRSYPWIWPIERV